MRQSLPVIHCSTIGGLIGSLAAVCISLQGVAHATPLAYVGFTRVPAYGEQAAPGVFIPPTTKAAALSSIPQQAAQMQCLLSTARAATLEGDYDKALFVYTEAVRQFPDLALSEYARIGRALLLYQLGDTTQALLELQSSEVSMKGYAEVHAALAAVLYAGAQSWS